MRRRRFLFLALGIALLTGVVIALLMRDGSDAIRIQIARDGTMVRLLKVSSGTSHTYFYGNLLQRFAARLLPDSLAKKYKIPGYKISTTNFTHAYWFEINDSRVPKLTPGGPLLYSVFATDKTGREYLAGQMLRKQVMGPDLLCVVTTKEPIARYALPITLHRRDMLREHLTHTNSSTLIATFPLPPRSRGR